MNTQTAKASVLIVDDEKLIRETLSEYLTDEGFAVTTSGTGEDALRMAGEQEFDAALVDLQLPGMDGLELLEKLLQVSPETCVISITAYGTVETAVAAFQRGAHDYLMKPILLEEVLSKLNRLLEYRNLANENQWLRRELHRAQGGGDLIGSTPGMLGMLEMVKKVAPTRSTVLLIGESGTGKELVARAIHRQSSDSATPFLPVNCAAIPNDLLENQLFGHRKGAFTGADRDQPGVFVHAGKGTVFLDEIGELPLATQAKLLRAIEQKEVLPVGANEPENFDGRIVAATNRDLDEAVEEGLFREDLYYRLNVVRISIPPLRDRREDIPELIDFLVPKHARIIGKRFTGVTHEAMQVLIACPWRGNVRELENALQRAMILGDGPLIGIEDLPPDLVPNQDDPALVENLVEAVSRFEKQHIERILRVTDSNKKEAAKRLGVALSSLYRKISELKITEEKETVS
ncbi:MAG: sigma-54-dependent transcriptional regulator [Gemmataceae bacterium]